MKDAKSTFLIFFGRILPNSVITDKLVILLRGTATEAAEAQTTPLGVKTGSLSLAKTRAQLATDGVRIRTGHSVMSMFLLEIFLSFVISSNHESDWILGDNGTFFTLYFIRYL